MGDRGEARDSLGDSWNDSRCKSRTWLTKGEPTLDLDGDDEAVLLCFGESGTRGEFMVKERSGNGKE